MSKIILLTGPSGSGKTTTAKQFIKNQTEPWAHINQDNIRQLVKAGYKTADGLRSKWDSETENQWNASIPICVDIAKRYSTFGISCLIDFYSTYSEYQSTWKKYLQDTEHSLIILMPNKETVIRRNNERSYPSKLTETKIIECFEDFQDWLECSEGLKLNNSKNTLEQSISEIKSSTD